MKNPLVYLIFLCFIFSNCTDNNTCTIEDWEGTYRGIKTCGTEIEDNYLFAVVRSNLSTLNMPNSIFVDGFLIVFDNCDIVGGQVSTPISSETYEGNLNGDEISITINSVNGNCRWTGTRVQ